MENKRERIERLCSSKNSQDLDYQQFQIYPRSEKLESQTGLNSRLIYVLVRLMSLSVVYLQRKGGKDD